jgi:hypothetical protein
MVLIIGNICMFLFIFCMLLVCTFICNYVRLSVVLQKRLKDQFYHLKYKGTVGMQTAEGIFEKADIVR